MPAQRAAKQKAITSKPYSQQSVLSDNEATPSLASVSDDHDRSSDFELDTPTKLPKSPKAILRYQASDDGSAYDDIKPDLTDDDEDVKPKIKTPKGKGGNKAKVPGSSSKKSTTSSGSGTAGGGKKLGQAWTGEEDWALFQYLHPKASKPDWKNAASAVGRDAKACQNRYAVFGKRLEAMIKNTLAK